MRGRQGIKSVMEVSSWGLIPGCHGVVQERVVDLEAHLTISGKELVDTIFVRGWLSINFLNWP